MIREGSSKSIITIIGRVLLTLLLCLVIIVLIFLIGFDVFCYNVETIVPAGVSCTVIEDERIPGKLEFYYDDKTPLYWLFHVNSDGKKTYYVCW